MKLNKSNFQKQQKNNDCKHCIWTNVKLMLLKTEIYIQDKHGEQMQRE